jgi:Tfp pilus assembly protein PilV
MNRRQGITLLEVLVAIFVLGLGLLALLTLFPLGALTMAQAVKDDRATLTAANGLAALQLWEAHLDAQVIAAMTQDPPLPAGWPADGPGWAVYVDPLGAFALPPPAYLGGTPATCIKRVSVQKLTSLPAGLRSQAAYSWCVLLDDVRFNDQGLPAGAAGPPSSLIEREGRYSWAALLRRPAQGSSVTEVSVVVYSGRSPGLNPDLNPAGETVGSVSPAAEGSTTLTLPFHGAAPAIRAGGWVVDATPEPGHGYFYRVVNVTTGPDWLELELQTPIRGPRVLPRPYAVTQVVLLEDVVEVFDKGTLGP